MSTARLLKFPFPNAVLEDVFEGGLEGMDGGIILAALEASELGWQQQ
jgi:hypothetical protein